MSGMTQYPTMGRAKIAITVDEQALAEVDRLVRRGVFLNRSKAFEEALQERISKLQRSRLARECAKLDVREEQALADEGYAGESEWSEY
jgi:Arc/MetJ-type ribon-helix-helix transcriptional regulator